MKRFVKFAGSLALVALALTAFSPLPSEAPLKPKKSKWVSLFDGKSLAGWHNYLGKGVSDKWVVEDGALAYSGGNGGGDIVTDKEYGDFELELEWKISEGGNSGIIYRVHEDPKFRSTYNTGPEMQVLDNERHPDAKMGRNGNRTAGSLYDLIPTSDPTAVKPVGQWNKVKLVVHNGRAEHWMNGKKVVDYATSGPEWDKMVSESKFKGWEGFGKFSKGRIALQDHGDKVWYRNIRIREL
ncbi:3-keto-disaccharide hydrolase [Tellurirhabdus rosea]|uniref:3-keto-disaccharide hydrolase n=1 Tax=Tellurirhabdus rosea TaxID=2674997 RepID=UPI00224C8506|nr:DUF1080 domain-containing protein [Tellurirhabdus rosea]